LLLPNGDVITVGLLGSGSETAAGNETEKVTGCCGGNSSLPLVRYNSDGTPIATTNRHHWWYLYYDVEVEPIPTGVMVDRSDGYIRFTDGIDGGLLSIWTYDGRPVATEAEAIPLDRHSFTWLRKRAIEKYFELQTAGR
jgi:hypothetical protein